MIESLSRNTQVILMLTAPLLDGREEASGYMLTPSEYRHLVGVLRDIGYSPEDFLGDNADLLFRAFDPEFGRFRLRSLLDRGFALAEAVERWQSRSIRVFSRADVAYPGRLKERLKADAPAVIYCCGATDLLASGGIAIVGSRDVDASLIDYTKSVGRSAALAHRTVVSGGARGVDQAAMFGALEAGGQVIGVLPDNLERATMAREYRNALLEGALVLMSPFDPNSRFTAGNAMQRNKLIYAMADAAFIVNAEQGKGGTWAGAVEQLDRLRHVPVYVRTTGEPSSALEALGRKGALPWPSPQQDAEWMVLFDRATLNRVAEAPVESAFGTARASGDAEALVTSPAPSSVPGPNDAFTKVREAIERLLVEPKTEAEIANALSVLPAQAKVWLKRLVDEGVVEKRTRPVVYVVKSQGLFG